MKDNRTLAYCQKYNIQIEFLQVCKDFIHCVFSKIFTTHLGREIMSEDSVCENHFSFYWNSVSKSFDEFFKYNFNSNEIARDYFKSMAMKIFYRNPIIISHQMIISTINSLFESDNETIYNLNKLFK